MPAWMASLLLHGGLLVVVSLLSFVVPAPYELRLSLATQEPLSVLPDEFQFRDEVVPEIGSAGSGAGPAALPSAPEIAKLPEIVKPTSIEREVGDIEYLQDLQQATAPVESTTQLVKGISGVGTTGASGAIDRITHEILLSLDEKDTLVVWLFDQSWSLYRQRAEIRERFSRIYQELGLISKKWEKTGDRHQPLLTSIVAFGATTNWMLEKPTADVDKIQERVAAIEPDESGSENVFSAVQEAAQRFSRLRSKRNIMLIVVSDEVGDDQQSAAEGAIEICQRFSIPVYVVGVPAAFGQAETLLKWVDPRPNHDPTPQLGRVNQGPESLVPERLHLPFGGASEEAIDSGFGPFALTRLCYQTGGIYFAIHPNRQLDESIGVQETSEFSAHLSRFFDPQRMFPYRPDYVSPREYEQQVQQRPHRAAVVRAAGLTIARMQNPRLRFVKRDEAEFTNELTEAQKVAAKLEPKLNMLYSWLQQGEASRGAETSLRWQAAYDLAMGQCLAVLVRTRTYNEMLAKAKRGLKPEDEKNNTWELAPDPDISVGSRHERDADRARTYLQRILADHAGTPWEYLARQELEFPMGWKWRESYTPPPEPQREAAPGNNNPPPPARDDQRQMLNDQPMIRDVPKL